MIRRPDPRAPLGRRGALPACEAERVAWLVSDMLSDNGARLISFGPNSVLNIGRPAAVKTGTTNDFRDNWTVGYTPDLVVGVWVGNADLEPMRDATGLTGAAPIWHNFMRTILDGSPERPFVRPNGLVQQEVCALSGLLMSEACPFPRTDWFIAGTVPVNTDSFYQWGTVDSRTNTLATAETPAEYRTEKRVLNLPSEAHNWARAEGITLLADVEAASGQTIASTAQGEAVPQNLLRLTAPSNNSIYRFSTELPADSQRIQLEAIGDISLAEVSFWMDGELVGVVTQPPYALWWPLAIGPHTVWVEGVTAEGELFTSEPVFFTVNEPDDNEFRPPEPGE